MPHGKTKRAINITRKLFTKMLHDPGAMLLLSINDVDLEEIEDKVHEILEYLEKTEPKKVEG